jgi:hypothetical protein
LVRTQPPLLIQESYSVLEDDTDLMIPSYEARYRYDSKGRLVEEFVYEWSSDVKRFRKQHVTTKEYNTHGLEAKVTYSYFVPDSDSVHSSEQNIYLYDSDGRLVSHRVINYSRLSPDVSESQIGYSYNSFGCLDMITNSTLRNGVVEVWNTVKYTSDDQCNFTFVKTEYFISNTYTTLETLEYADGNLTAHKGYYIDHNNDTLTSFEKLYAYNEANQKIFEQVTRAYMAEYAYSAVGQIVNEKKYWWNHTDGAWHPPLEYVYTYNGFGLLEELDIYYMESLFQTTNYAYDEEHRLVSTLETTFDFNGNVSWKTLEVSSYRCDGAEALRETYFYSIDEPVLRFRTEYFYMMPAPCENRRIQTAEVYPNPTIGLVTIIPDRLLESYIVQVYNSAGQFLHEQRVENGLLPVQIDLGTFASGAYIVSVSAQSYYATAKVIKIDR